MYLRQPSSSSYIHCFSDPSYRLVLKHLPSSLSILSLFEEPQVHYLNQTLLCLRHVRTTLTPGILPQGGCLEVAAFRFLTSESLLSLTCSKVDCHSECRVP